MLAKLASHLGTSNIDHRIGRRDVSDQVNDPVYAGLGCSIADIENQGAVLVAGSNIRNEAPIIAHRLRKAALAGARINFANSREYEYFFDVADYLSGDGLVEMLAGVAVAAAGKRKMPASVAAVCAGITARDAHKRIAATLHGADESLVLLGCIAGRHAAYSVVRALGAAIAELTGAKLGYITDGPNSAGAHLAGVLPHREGGGKERAEVGLGVAAMLDAPMDAIVLVNVEPENDIHATKDAVAKLARQKYVVAITPFVSDGLLEAADLLLPMGTFAETSGTYVNAAGTWQSFVGVATPVGEARPCWKVLRVLGNLVDAPGFNYVTSEDVLREVESQLGEVKADTTYKASGKFAKPNGKDAPADEIDTPLYSVDALVRRSTALQLTAAALRAAAEANA